MLIGISPDFTDVVPFSGAEFTLRPLPYGKWARFRQEAVDAYRRAMTRAIRDLKLEDLEPDEEVVVGTLSNGTTVKHTRVRLRAEADALYLEEIVRIEAEVVRWGLIGHSAFCAPDGSPVPFVTEQATHEGERIDLVSRQTMRWYRANHILMAVLHNRLWKICELGPTEKKASPQPSSTIEASSIAPAAPLPLVSSSSMDATRS